MIRQEGAKALITTPDYLPRLGGLSTFTIQLETILKNMKVPYDLFIWGDVSKLKSSKKNLGKYDVVFNVQAIGSFFMQYESQKVINFIHGSEILFHSPNILKKMIKKVLKKKIFSSFEKSFFNIFISHFTKNKMVEQGYQLSYARDLVFHNCTDAKNASYHLSSLDEDEWRFICVARDVPHKNMDGVRKLCHSAFKNTNKSIKLFVTSELAPIHGVEMVNISGVSNEELVHYYKNAHFNTLLSLDHAHKGFFEGFGLTVLESALYGTPSIVSAYGGLPEAVHHSETGWVMEDLTESSYDLFWKSFNPHHYHKISQNAYSHTLEVHSLHHYQKLIERCLK